MQVIRCKNYEEMSKVAADIVEGQIKDKADSVLGFPTGSTPIGMYKEISSRNIDFSKSVCFNLDEYYPIDPSNDQSYYYFMNENLYKNTNFKAHFIENGNAADPVKECADYETKIAQHGGLDLQVVGVGGNGHIGFNEPDAELVADTHKVTLTEETIIANSRFFESADDVPREALTMGMGTILKAKKILFIVNGENKREVLDKMLSGVVTTTCPITFLNLHPNVVVVTDIAE